MKVQVLYIDHVKWIGGAETSLLTLLRNLNRRRYDSVVLCPPNGPLAEELAIINNVSVEGINFQKVTRSGNLLKLIIYNTFFFFTIILQISRIIKLKKIDLIHANSLKSAIMGGLAAKLVGVPIIWHVRDFLPVGKFRGILIKFPHHLADKIIVNSLAVGNMMNKEVGGSNKVIMIYNAVDPVKTNSKSSGKEVRKELKIGLSTPVIGFVGRIHPEKGLEYLVKAMHKVVKAIPKVQLLVVGDTTLGDKEYYQAIKDLVKRLDLQYAIVFLGYQKDVSKIMNAFDVFALPSLREPFGLVTLEAMAMAKPVIATDTGGTPEIVINGQTGILVPPRNVDTLADAIIKLLRDKELARRMGLASRARIHNCFSVENMMDQIEDVYEGVLVGRRT